jgi:3-(3-hydroxy-phenyl)propionate hydroxylase
MRIEWAEYFDYPRHALVMPRLAGGIDERRHRVVIAGGGPTGLTLALALARFRIPSVVLEADDTVCLGSRATCISRRSLEILQRVGAHEAFVAKGLGWTGGRSFYRNTEVFQLQMPHDEDQKFPPMINLQQCYTEQFLVDAVAAHGDLIDVRWQTRVSAVQPGEHGVRVQVQTAQGGYALDSDWLVACDGARSVARQALGLKFEGTQYEGRYVIVDIDLKSDYPTQRRAWFDPPSNPGSTLLMHKQPDNIWRLDYQLREDEDADEAVKPENVIPRVASHLRMIGERDDWRPVWISMYKANALTLERYRHGHVLFAGDAAHLVPIFGVRGMNSGIDDSDNLAWKLAAVLQGWATDALLDTYSDERVFAARENLRYSMRSTEFMAPPSHGFELMRRAVLTLALEHEWVRPLINPRQTAAIPLYDSALNAALHRSREFAVGPRPGDVLSEMPITRITPSEPVTGFLTDLLGAHFLVLYFSVAEDVPAALSRRLSELLPREVPVKWCAVTQSPAEAGTLHDATGRVFRRYGATPGTAYLVRPDGYVMARWQRLDVAELAESLRRMTDLAKEKA